MSSDSPKKLVSARGAGEGVILRLDPDVSSDVLIPELESYLEERKEFLSGNEVSLDWSDGFPTNQLTEDVTACLQDKFSIKIKSESTENGLTSKLHVTGVSSFRPQRSSADFSDTLEASNGQESFNESMASSGSNGLLSGIGEITDDFTEEPSKSSSQSNPLSNSMFWDNPDAMIVHATLRSGQRIESENSVILIGDVNYGGEVISGGDVIVLGTLRGVVHAGAYDENGGGRFIFSLDLQPTQLRIGSVISRGMETKSKVSEIAYVDGNAIVVEQYSSRNAASLAR